MEIWFYFQFQKQSNRITQILNFIAKQIIYQVSCEQLVCIFVDIVNVFELYSVYKPFLYIDLIPDCID